MAMTPDLVVALVVGLAGPAATVAVAWIKNRRGGGEDGGAE